MQMTNILSPQMTNIPHAATVLTSRDNIRLVLNPLMQQVQTYVVPMLHLLHTDLPLMLSNGPQSYEEVNPSTPSFIPLM